MYKNSIDLQNVDSANVDNRRKLADEDDLNTSNWYCSRRFPEEASTYARVRTACVRALRFFFLFLIFDFFFKKTNDFSTNDY